MPRNDLKAYETLTARIPQDLVDAARRYASEHQCTVSELIRDSLQRYLYAEDEVIQEVRPHTQKTPFDTAKYRLGKLCPRGHEWGNTGLSLRKNNKAGGCLTCDADQAHARRQQKRQQKVSA